MVYYFGLDVSPIEDYRLIIECIYSTCVLVIFWYWWSIKNIRTSCVLDSESKVAIIFYFRWLVVVHGVYHHLTGSILGVLN